MAKSERMILVIDEYSVSGSGRKRDLLFIAELSGVFLSGGGCADNRLAASIGLSGGLSFQCHDAGNKTRETFCFNHSIMTLFQITELL